MSTTSSPIYKFGPFSLIEAEHRLVRGEEPVGMTPKVFDLLLFLVKNAGHLVEKGELINHLWPESFVEETNLNRNISVLRKLLGEDDYIETVPKRGYRFISRVECGTADLRVRDRAYEKMAPPASSLAVLPFSSLGADLADDYLGLGIADGLITRLSNLRGVIVRPTSAIVQYANRTVDAASAGCELRVSSVLEGSVRRSGPRIRVTAQLVTVSDGASVWANTFEEDLTDIFAVEDSICERVASALKPLISDLERSRLVKHYTDNVEAYRAYLKGRYYSFKMTAEGLTKAMECFSRAIEIDPNYALSYAGLADAFTTASEWQLSPKEAMSKAKAAALRAIELDPGLTEARAALAHVKIHTLDPTAEADLKAAIELNPNYPLAYLWYCELLCMQGRLDEAVDQTRRALELDPLSPLCNFFLSFPLYLAKRYEEAIPHLRETIEMNPFFWYAYWSLGGMYLMTGRVREAIAEFEKARDIEAAPPVMAGLASAYAADGDHERAVQILEELRGMSKDRYVSPYDLAKIYLSIGQVETSIDMLEQAFFDQSEFAIFLAVDPAWESLRSTPRIAALIERVRSAQDGRLWDP